MSMELSDVKGAAPEPMLGTVGPTSPARQTQQDPTVFSCNGLAGYHRLQERRQADHRRRVNCARQQHPGAFQHPLVVIRQRPLL
jgi:hypothetical protein